MIALRPVEPGDRDRLYAWRREPEVDRWMDADPPASPEQHAGWFANLLDNPDRLGWIVLQKEKPCGFLQITGVGSRQRRGQWRWYIGDPDARGRGRAARPRRWGSTTPSTSACARSGPRWWRATRRP